MDPINTENDKDHKPAQLDVINQNRKPLSDSHINSIENPLPVGHTPLRPNKFALFYAPFPDSSHLRMSEKYFSLYKSFLVLVLI
jgi:hypothetical protein